MQASDDPTAPRPKRRVPLSVALQRTVWAVAFWVNFRRTCLRAGYFDPAFYRGTVADRGAGWAGRTFARLWPMMHYLLFGHRAKLPPVAGYDHDRAVARFPFHKWVRLSPLEAYVLFGRLTGGEFLAPDATPVDPPRLPAPAADTALVVHAFHLAEFRMILARVAALGSGVDVYVTTTHPRGEIAAMCEAAGVAPRLIHYGPNRGRDVAPFCRLLEAGLTECYAVVGKVHTKRSAHRPDGGDWFRNSLDGLLAPESFATAHACLTGSGSTGLVAPPGRLGGDPGRAANRAHMAVMIARSGLGEAALEDYTFPHGTMFWARSAALGPLADLDLRTDNFEAEAGQLDGTLAHAVERMIGVYCLAAGYDQVEAADLLGSNTSGAGDAGGGK